MWRSRVTPSPVPLSSVTSHGRSSSAMRYGRSPCAASWFRSSASTPSATARTSCHPTTGSIGAAFRLLRHFPRIVRRLPDDSFDLILAGHLHAGQIYVPWPGGRVGLARATSGPLRRRAGTMHFSSGTGTTFVHALRTAGVTELVLRRVE